MKNFPLGMSEGCSAIVSYVKDSHYATALHAVV